MKKIYSDLIQMMKDVSYEWMICGGRAIDFFVGKQTRLHKDLDIAVFGKIASSGFLTFYN